MKVRELIAHLQDDIDPEAEIIVRQRAEWPILDFEISSLTAYRDERGRPTVELGIL